MQKLQTYSLSELKQMPKEKVIKLDMRQLPLPEKVLNYFHNRYKEFQKKKLKNTALTATINFDRYESITKLYVFSLANLLLVDNKTLGERGKAIYDLCSKLEMKYGDIFSFNYPQSMSKNELLECSIFNLRFPNTQAFSCMRNDNTYRDIDIEKNTRLKQFLNFDIHKEHGDWPGPPYGPKGAKKVKNHLLKLGFSMGEFPILNKDYWDMIEEWSNQ